MFRVAVSGRRDQEASFFTVVVWRDQAEHAAESLSKGSRVVVMGRLQQRSWTAEDDSARSADLPKLPMCPVRTACRMSCCPARLTDEATSAAVTLRPTSPAAHRIGRESALSLEGGRCALALCLQP